MIGSHSSAEVRGDVVATLESLRERTKIPMRQLLTWAGIHKSRFDRWRQQQRCASPERSTRLHPSAILPEERDAILAYRTALQREGRSVSYRIQTNEMLDNDIAACSESTVYRVLKEAGHIRESMVHPTKKGAGFQQPQGVHMHWHTDISYLWEFGYRAYLVAVIDGFSRAVLHHQVMRSMTTGDVELVLQVAHEKYPHARPRVITDNGSQFISNQFKGFLADCGFTHAKTSVSYPQSIGKMERQFRTTKEELRQRSILDFDDLVAHVSDIITYYNTLRYHSALAYITPQDVLDGRAEQIQTARRMKLEDARERRMLVNSHMFI